MSHIHQKPLYIQPCFGGKGMKGGRCLGVPLLIFNSPLIECNLTQGREEEEKKPCMQIFFCFCIPLKLMSRESHHFNKSIEVFLVLKSDARSKKLLFVTLRNL